VKLVNLLSGGRQEKGSRAGTENVLLIAGMGAAAEVASTEAAALQQHLQAMRDRLAAGLAEVFPRDLVRVNGPSDQRQRLPNTLSISVKGLAASSLLQQLSNKLAASAGTACHSSGGPAVSPVLAAMRLQPEYAVGTLRLSVGRHTTAAEVDRAVQLIARCCCEARLVPVTDGGLEAAPVEGRWKPMMCGVVWCARPAYDMRQCCTCCVAA